MARRSRVTRTIIARAVNNALMAIGESVKKRASVVLRPPIVAEVPVAEVQAVVQAVVRVAVQAVVRVAVQAINSF